MYKKISDLHPIGDKVIIEPMRNEQISASGIIIPQTKDSEYPEHGTVVALGNGGTFDGCPNPHDFLKVGDHVLFNKYAGEDITIKNENGTKTEYKQLHLSNIHGYFDN